ncbi:MAG TPA: hypothetical protein VIJ29_04575 [Candidatus Paceibacterota bacterium]
MLEELRSLSEANKKRVLIIATIIIMVIIIGVWVTYFNSIVIGNSSGAAAQATSTVATSTAPVPIAIAPAPAASVPTQASGPGVWQDIKNFFSAIANIFRKPSQYNIQPQ